MIIRRVAGNAAWNVSGAACSLIAGAVALPIIMRTIGSAGLGVFTLAVGLVGFSGALDLGFSRALTQKVAHDVGEGKPSEAVAYTVWRLIWIMAGLGAAFAALLVMILPWFVRGPLGLQGAFARDAIFGLQVVACSLPAALAGMAAVGALEGLQEFRRISMQRALLGVLQFAIPVAIAYATRDVGYVVAGLALSRPIALLVWLRTLNTSLPYRTRIRGEDHHLSGVTKFAGWLSVSNVVGALVVYGDRFYLASVFPPSQIIHYTAPFDAIHRATSLPATVLGAVFPALAGLKIDAAGSQQIVRATCAFLIASMVPVLGIVSLGSWQLLNLWLGSTFADDAQHVVRWLVVGVFLNSMAYLPFSLLQSRGRTDLTAALHGLEVPVFLVILVACVTLFGVAGAAMAWAARSAIDMLCMHLISMFVCREIRQEISRSLALSFAGGLVLLGPAVFSSRVAFALVGLIGIFVVAATGLDLLEHLKRDAKRGELQ